MTISMKKNIFKFSKLALALAFLFSDASFAKEACQFKRCDNETQQCITESCVTPPESQQLPPQKTKRKKYTKNLPKVLPKPSYDALDVDKYTSLKEIPKKEVDLPGVVKLVGDPVTVIDSSKVHRIPWGNNGIQTIPLSMFGPNQIVVPFNDPYIVSNTYLDVKKRPNNNNIYVSFNFPEGVKPIPITIFIEDPQGGPAIGLQLVPKRIPQQEYVIVDELLRLRSNQRNNATDYATHIQFLMESVALGGTPSGYSTMPFDLPPIVVRGVTLKANKRLSNTEGDIYVYDVMNPTQQTIQLDEKDFDGVRVKAVSIFPRPILVPNEQAKLIIFAKKEGDI